MKEDLVFFFFLIRKLLIKGQRYKKQKLAENIQKQESKSYNLATNNKDQKLIQGSSTNSKEPIKNLIRIHIFAL